ncbi:MAG: M20/M25/M40 family metallo-hydrolase [Peptococcaceae bacterium]|nr:M20/M25/M40 family metallo-hydrolase [Peptococcaceae bacterium]
MEEKINRYLDTIAPQLIEMADDIFDHPELPYEEVRSSGILCDWLEKEGFTVQRGIEELNTAFKAVYQNGPGGLNIGLLCEYDCLPNGHSCGHHMQGPVILGAAAALKNSGLNIPFTITVYGTPAEEVLTGKPKMIEKGCFRELDVALMTHAGEYCCVRTQSLTGINLKVVFTGVHAHDTAMPWANRSGFDAFVLAMQGMEFLRGHVHDGTRLFHQLYDAIGVKGNTDPSRAEGVFACRTFRLEDKEDLEKRMRNILEGAALMSGVKVEIEKTLDVMGTLGSESLGKLVMKFAKELDAPQINENVANTGGSNDFANITHLLPGTIARVATTPPGVATHSVEFLKYGKSQLSHESTVIGAKIIAQACAEMLKKPEILREVKTEFSRRKAELAEKIAVLNGNA